MPANNGNATPKLVRCAIYTRKSTDEGLDRDFNSLDAQREAAEAFTRARMTQIMNLLNLAPDIQERILLPDSSKAVPCERRLRGIVILPCWREQRCLLVP